MHAGLTGGVGSGKSTVAAELARLGAIIFDSDQLARELLSKNAAGYQAVAEAFGDSILGQSGELDRAELAKIIFKDEASRCRLDAILHPLIVARRRELLAEIKRSAPPDVVVISEAALIFEAGTRGEFDCVILVSAPEAIRRARLAERGWSAAHIAARISSQWDDERKKQLADYVIDNGDGLESLKEQVGLVWSRLLERQKSG